MRHDGVYIAGGGVDFVTLVAGRRKQVCCLFLLAWISAHMQAILRMECDIDQTIVDTAWPKQLMTSVAREAGPFILDICLHFTKSDALLPRSYLLVRRWNCDVLPD